MQLAAKKPTLSFIVGALILLAAAPVFAAGARNSGAAQAVRTDPSMLAPFSRYPETIQVSSARVMNRGNQLPPGQTTTDNFMIDVIRDKLNVQFVIAWETSPDQYAQRLALSIAAGNLPDVFYIDRSNFLTFNALVENNRLADLTEPYTQSIGGYAADMIRPLNGAHLTQVTRNGRIYAIPQIPTGYNYNLLWVRKDWLDKVNMPVPRTLEEMKNTALAFQRAQLGGPNTIGIVTDSVTVLGQSHSFLSLSTIANAVNAYPKSWIRDKSGNVIWGSVAPEMKDALAVLADWYRAGILDPQFMTYQNMDAVTPAIREGRTGMYFGAYWSPWTVADTMVQDTAMEWVYVLGPVDANGKFNHVNPLDPDSLVVVASTARNPEAVVKAANVLHQLENGAYFNEPGILDRYNATIGIAGARTLTPIPGNLANEFDRELKKGIAIAGYINTGRLDMWPTATTNDREDAEKAYAWYENPSRTNTDGYSLYNSFMTMNDIANADFNYDQPIAYAFTTMSMADYWPALLSLENEMIIQIISGQRPLSYFDDFVREWKAGGGDIITNEVRAITK